MSPSSKKKTRATLEDKATFWNATSFEYIRHVNIKINISLSERERILKSQILPTWANTNIATSSKDSNLSAIRVEPITSASSQRPEISSTNTDPAAETCSSDECGICCKTIDIWGECNSLHGFSDNIILI